MKIFYPYLLRFVFGAVTVVLISFLPFGLAAAVEEPPDFITRWGSQGSGDGQFYDPYGVAVDTADNIYVADTYNHRIQKFDSEGNFIIKWGSYGWGDGQLRYPQGVAVDSADNVYVVDTSNHRIQKFDSDGTFLGKLGSYGWGDGRFYFPKGVAVDSEDNVLVTDMRHRIQKFDSDGTFLTKWGSYGSGDGKFYYPHGVAVDSADNVYVADTYNHRIQKFDSDGTFLTKWGSGGSGDGQFYYSFGVAVDTADNVYVADTHNHRIQKFGLTIVNDPTIEVDIRPWSCVNPLNVRSRGVLPVAILGSEVFDVRDIDTRTIRLSSDGTELEVWPIRGRYEDVSASFEGELYDCQGTPDGLEDLILKFRTQDVVRAIGKVNHGEEVVLTITGTLVDQITEFEGTDSVKIIKRRKKNKYPKKNKRRKK